MRKQLKGLTEEDYWLYGIKETDFDHAINLVKEMVEARIEQYEKQATEIRKREMEPDVLDEILADTSYYIDIDNQYLWHFALWRLQGLFEAVITHQLIDLKDSKKLFGLKSKLIALKKNGYSINKNEIDELTLWANLRNAISHSPPEQYAPTSLSEKDITEYYNFIKSLYQRWKIEKVNKINI
ncbi:MAG: hypothetical protein COB42_08945 [Sulfurimonas sp.]|nr:MAG: hypothetical protein COB42_08945 [Sulfurimonas sp.]